MVLSFKTARWSRAYWMQQKLGMTLFVAQRQLGAFCKERIIGWWMMWCSPAVCSVADCIQIWSCSGPWPLDLGESVSLEIFCLFCATRSSFFFLIFNNNFPDCNLSGICCLSFCGAPLKKYGLFFPCRYWRTAVPSLDFCRVKIPVSFATCPMLQLPNHLQNLLLDLLQFVGICIVLRSQNWTRCFRVPQIRSTC